MSAATQFDVIPPEIQLARKRWKVKVLRAVSAAVTVAYMAEGWGSDELLTPRWEKMENLARMMSDEIVSGVVNARAPLEPRRLSLPYACAEPVARIRSTATWADIESAIEAAKASQREWGHMP